MRGSTWTTIHCTVPNCDSPRAYGRAMHCEKHYTRLRRTGTVDRLPARKAQVKYRAAHWRIANDRGPAHTHECTDCGQPAEHWAYDHGDPNELVSETGQPYSLDIMRYEPRCAPCHARFDGTGANQYTRAI